MPTWLSDLIDEYANQRINEGRALRLARAFADETEETMQAAVLAYIRENKFFPRTADLNSYVLSARENERGHIAYDQLQQQVSYGRFGHGSHTDDDILTWEQQRGTIPPNPQLNTEYLAQTQKELPNAN